MGLLQDFFGEFFPCEVKNIIFMWRGAPEMRLNPYKVRLNIETNIPARVGVEHDLDGVGGVGVRGAAG